MSTRKINVLNLYDGKAVYNYQSLSIENGIIIALEPISDKYEAIDYEFLAPAFIDIHINGGNQFHFTQQPTVASVMDIAEASHATGCFYTLPTLITSSTDNIFKGIDAVRTFKAQHPEMGVLGMHLEGPYISKQKRGAHLEKYIRKPSTAELKELITYGEGVLKMITIAPELIETADLELLLQSGIRVSAGHSNATYEQTRDFFQRGGDLITHFYNAMSGFTHRAPGMVGAILEASHAHVPIILDGIHCDFGAARLAYKSLSDKLFLISDALFLGHHVERFQWEEFDATLQGDRYVNSEGNLAGGAISMGTAVRNAVKEVGIPLEVAIAMATHRAACALHLEAEVGRIAVGYPAVFTTFDLSLEEFLVVRL